MRSAGAPRSFRRQLRAHNRHVLFGAFISALAAALAWAALYFLAKFFTLGAITAVRGDRAVLPEGFHTAFGIAAAVLLLVGFFGRMFLRYRPLRDRPIIGWHALFEVMLTPVSLIFAIWDNLSAYRRLSPADVYRAWDLLTEIHRRNGLGSHELELLDMDARRADRLLLTLQLCGFIDLHRVEHGWQYRVRDKPRIEALLKSEENDAV